MSLASIPFRAECQNAFLARANDRLKRRIRINYGLPSVEPGAGPSRTTTTGKRMRKLTMHAAKVKRGQRRPNSLSRTANEIIEFARLHAQPIPDGRLPTLGSQSNSRNAQNAWKAPVFDLHQIAKSDERDEQVIGGNYGCSVIIFANSLSPFSRTRLAASNATGCEVNCTRCSMSTFCSNTALPNWPVASKFNSTT